MTAQREKPKNSLLAQFEDSWNVTVDPQLLWLNHSGVTSPGRQKLGGLGQKLDGLGRQKLNGLRRQKLAGTSGSCYHNSNSFFLK